MTDSDRSETDSGNRRDRRRQFGCIFLLAAVLVVVALFVWIDSQHTREPPHNDIAPMQGPPETGPVQPPA